MILCCSIVPKYESYCFWKVTAKYCTTNPEDNNLFWRKTRETRETNYKHNATSSLCFFFRLKQCLCVLLSKHWLQLHLKLKFCLNIFYFFYFSHRLGHQSFQLFNLDCCHCSWKYLIHIILLKKVFLKIKNINNSEGKLLLFFYSISFFKKV